MKVEAKSRPKVTVKENFRKCPDCGKNDGFHVLLVGRNGSRPSEFGVRLACPKCRRVFQIGLVIEEKKGKK